jgi:hypothetical protein
MTAGQVANAAPNQAQGDDSSQVNL